MFSISVIYLSLFVFALALLAAGIVKRSRIFKIVSSALLGFLVLVLFLFNFSGM